MYIDLTSHVGGNSALRLALAREQFRQRDLNQYQNHRHRSDQSTRPDDADVVECCNIAVLQKGPTAIPTTNRPVVERLLSEACLIWLAMHKHDVIPW